MSTHTTIDTQTTYTGNNKTPYKEETVIRSKQPKDVNGIRK